MAEEEKRKKRWKLIINIVTIGALVGLVYFLRSEIAETLENIGSLKWWALALMIPAQILNYHAYAVMYRGLFDILGHKITYKKWWKIVLELNFVNNVFPSGGVSGFSYFGLRLRREGVSAGQATLVQIMRFVLLFISFQVLLVAGLIILAIGGEANSLTILIAGSLATALLIGSFAAMFIIGSKKRINGFFTYITRFLNRVIHIVRPKHPETISIERVEAIFTDLHENYLVLKENPKVLRGPLVAALFANIAEILTIYVVYIAFGQWVNLGAIILAYAIANFAGMISVLPGGVGIYEALMTAVLASAGVPPAVSIPVTITYRVLNMALQLPPGYYFYHKAIHSSNLPIPNKS
jgi:uncharacterized protein (TIRG00374 family)